VRRKTRAERIPQRITAKEDLPSGEKIIAKFHPHALSFMRWYAPSFILMVWTAVFFIVTLFNIVDLSILEAWLGDARDMAPLVFWFLGAVAVGFILPSNPRTSRENVSAHTFLRAVRIFYWILLLVPLVIVTYLTIQDPLNEYRPLTYVFALGIAALMVFIYDIYRRSFTYYVTNFRIIFRYKFFNTVERTIRFSKVEDVEVSRSLLQRIFKLGNVRPYSGAEENLIDLTPGYDSPDECFFGVRNPYYVKRILLEQMLGPQDQIQDSVYRLDAKERQAAVYGGPAAARKAYGGADMDGASAVKEAAATGGPGGGAPGGAAQAAGSAAAPAPARRETSTDLASNGRAASADADRVKKLEEELARLRRDTSTQRERTAMDTEERRAREEAKREGIDERGGSSTSKPTWREPAVADTRYKADEKRGAFAQGAQPAATRKVESEHAGFGDDRDALRGSEDAFRPAEREKPKKSLFGDEQDDAGAEPEDDKPRSI
jgi:membrane protein YdbS with pleckstrin-like domain